MSDMETQSDSIDITSIKYAALGGFEPSKAANFERDVSGNDRLRAIQHAFQRSIAASTTSPSSPNTGYQAVATVPEPGHYLTQQNTSTGLASTVPETQTLVDVGNPLSLAAHAAAAGKPGQLPKKMSTQGSLPQDTQPVSQSIFESIITKAKTVRQPDQNTNEQDDVEAERSSLQEGDKGHIDLLSSYNVQNQELGDDLDSEPVDFSPTQTQHHLSQFPDSQRFKTPGTTSRKRDYNGEPIETPTLPRNPLARNGTPTPGKMMGLSQAFAATQAVTSPFVNGLPSGPLSDRPSPNIELQTRPATASPSSPLQPRSHFGRVATEPYSHYKSIKQSQTEREILRLFGLPQGGAISDNVSEDDFDDEPSLVERNRRLKEREEKVRQQLQAVSSPIRPRSRGSAGPLSSPMSRPQTSSAITSSRSYRRTNDHFQGSRRITATDEGPEKALANLTHESEEETEQEDEVEITRPSQLVLQTEEDKENIGFAGLEVPETVARFQGPIDGHHGVESSPSIRQSAGSDRKNDAPPESDGVEPFAVANSQPSQSTRKPSHQPHTQLTSSEDGLSFVPQSQGFPNVSHTSSSPVRSNFHNSSTYVGHEGVTQGNTQPEVTVERISTGNERLPLTEAVQPDLEAGSGEEVIENPTATVQSPGQTFDQVSSAQATGLGVQAPRFDSRQLLATQTMVPETSSLRRRETDLASSAPQLDKSKPASSSSEQAPRSSTEFETAQTHLSTRVGLTPILRQTSYITTSPSGRKRRRMTEIAADLSPRKSDSGFEVDMAMETVVDKEFEHIIGSSSPIPPGRYIKRRLVHARQPKVVSEDRTRVVAAEPVAVGGGPEKGHMANSEEALPTDTGSLDSDSSLQSYPQATRSILRSSNVKRQLPTPAQRPLSGRIGTRISRPAESIFDIHGSPEMLDEVKSKTRTRKLSNPPSTMPARQARASIAVGSPASATQIGESTRRGSQESIPTPNGTPDPIVPGTYDSTSHASDAPLGDVTAPNQVLACFNGKTRAYYPATCLGITGSDSLRYQIQWEGFEADETDARGIRRLDLRVGDAVKVNLEGFPKISYVVRGFKDRVLPSGKDSPMTDIRGYSVLLVAPKQRKSLPANLNAEAVKEVPVSAIYLDSNMWSQMKGREYEYTPQHPASAIGFATPPERPSTPATPSSRSRRNLALGTNTASAEPRGIFIGMAFAISYDEARKSSLTQLIGTNGGFVLLEGFHELFEIDSMMLKSKFSNLGFTALIADRHSRKEKYMQALALGLPCLSGKWIESCIARERVIDWRPYLLPAGESAVLEGATRSRILPAIPDPSSAKMADMIETRSKLLNGSSVIFVTGRGKAEEKRRPFVFLTQAIGAGRIQKVADLNGAKALLDGGEGYTRICVDDNLVGVAESMFAGQQVRVLGNEFICQSLILGELVGE